jgi:hypothetical protein
VLPANDDALLCEAFRRRPLDGAPYRVDSMAVLALRVRESGRIVSAAALIAVGVSRDGRREILGLEVASVEDGTAWNPQGGPAGNGRRPQGLGGLGEALTGLA